jgi:hypothetical protein
MPYRPFRGFAFAAALTVSMAVSACGGEGSAPDSTSISRTVSSTESSHATGPIPARPLLALPDLDLEGAKRMEAGCPTVDSKPCSFINGLRQGVNFVVTDRVRFC